MVPLLLASTASAATAATASAEATSALESIVTSVVPSAIASALPSAITTTTPVTAAPVFLPPGFEVMAILAGAVTGGIVGVKRGFDITGVLTLALVAGLGGGIIRDLLLQDYGIFALETPRALIAAIAGGLIAMFFLKAATAMTPAFKVVDALSLALFCLVGSDKALVAGLTAMAAIVLGVITSVGGGMLRDILCDREPEVLRRGSLYSSVAIVGSTLYVGLATWLNITKGVALAVAAIVAVLLRLGSVYFGWESPEPVDLTDTVVQAPGKAVRASRRLWEKKP